MINDSKVHLLASLLTLMLCCSCTSVVKGKRMPSLEHLTLIAADGSLSNTIPSQNGRIRVLKFWGAW